MLLLGCLASVALIVRLSRLPIFKASSPRFLLLVCLGVMLLLSSVYARTEESSTASKFARDSACAADLFLANLGYTLIGGALLLKTYRPRSIFLRKTLSAKVALLKDSSLSLLLLALLILETALLLGLYFGAGPLESMLQPFGSSDHAYDSVDYFACGSEHDAGLTKIFLPVTISARFLLLGVLALCVFSVRNVPERYNETRQLLITSYNLLFLSILLPAIDATMDRGKDAALLAYSLCVFIICSLTVAIILAPKIHTIWKLPKGATAAMGAGAGTRGVTNNNATMMQQPTAAGGGENDTEMDQFSPGDSAAPHLMPTPGLVIGAGPTPAPGQAASFASTFGAGAVGASRSGGKAAAVPTSSSASSTNRSGGGGGGARGGLSPSASSRAFSRPSFVSSSRPLSSAAGNGGGGGSSSSGSSAGMTMSTTLMHIPSSASFTITPITADFSAGAAAAATLDEVTLQLLEQLEAIAKLPKSSGIAGGASSSTTVVAASSTAPGVEGTVDADANALPPPSPSPSSVLP